MARPDPILIDLAANRIKPGTSLSPGAYNSALEHRVSGLVHHAIASGDFVVIDELRRSSAEGRLVMRANTLKLWDDLETVASTLAEVGFEVAVLKGIATDLLYYPATGSRPSADLDVVIDPASLDRISEAVAALDPSHGLLGSVDDLVHRNRIQSVDIRLASGTWLDLHVDPVKTGLRLRTRDAMWRRTSLHSAPDGRTLRALAASDALILAVIHQLKDRFSQLRGHADIARIVHSGSIDWDVVAATVEEEGLAGLFWPALSIILDELHMHSVVAPTPSIGTFSVNRVWPPDTRLRGHTGMERKVRAKHAIPFLMRGRLGEALGHFWRVLFPPRAVLSYMHPQVEGPYFVRLLRMRFGFARARHRRNRRDRRLNARSR